MNTLLWSIVLFIVGAIEFAIDQYEKLVSVRLKFSQTMWFGILNQWFDFVMNIFLFGILISFWEKWHEGVHDYAKLWMYFAYINGRVVGTGAAVLLYHKGKKKRDKARAIKLLEKARHKKKEMGKLLKTDISADVEVGELFDTVETEDIKNEIKERAIEKVSDQIAARVDEAFNEQSIEESVDAKQEINKDNS